MTPGRRNRAGRLTRIVSRLRFGLIAALSLLALPAVAAPIANPVATFSGLDKITARITNFDVYINETVQFGSLQITPRACYTRPPEEAQRTSVFVEVDKVSLNGTTTRIFTGWMFADSPALNAVDDAIYDFWLVDCKQHSDVPPPSPDATPAAPTAGAPAAAPAGAAPATPATAAPATPATAAPAPTAPQAPAPASPATTPAPVTPAATPAPASPAPAAPAATAPAAAAPTTSPPTVQGKRLVRDVDESETVRRDLAGRAIGQRCAPWPQRLMARAWARVPIQATAAD